MKEIFKIILLLAIGTVLGFFVLPQFMRRPVEQSLEVRPEYNPAWREKLQNLTDQDLTEYYRLKSLEERYKKADEILGKIMVIFLADLGLHVSHEAAEHMKSNLIAAPHVSEATTKTSGHADEAPVVNESAPTNANLWGWVAAEKSRELLRSDREVPGFLEKVKIANLDEAMKSSVLFDNRTGSLDSLKGRFSGIAHVTYNEKARDWTVDLFLDASVVGGRLQGVARAKIFENGKEFSNSSDKGDMASYREFTSGSEATIIKVSPTIALQVYYIKSTDSLVGNMYLRATEDEPYRHIGTLNLKR